MAEPQLPTRCGFVALIGAPNAGKSTLLNQLVGAKVSIVSRKVQTTRTQVRGIALSGPTQIIFAENLLRRQGLWNENAEGEHG